MLLQKGFVGLGVLMAIFVGVAVLGGCAYYIVHQQVFTGILPVDTVDSGHSSVQAADTPTSLMEAQNEYVLFTASHNSGAAPLTVSFISNKYSSHDSGEPQHYVDYGDGTERGRITCTKSTGTNLGDSRCLEFGVVHTYESNGTYVAKLIEVAPCTETCSPQRQERVLRSVSIGISEKTSATLDTPKISPNSKVGDKFGAFELTGFDIQDLRSNWYIAQFSGTTTLRVRYKINTDYSWVEATALDYNDRLKLPHDRDDSRTSTDICFSFKPDDPFVRAMFSSGKDTALVEISGYKIFMVPKGGTCIYSTASMKVVGL